MTWWRGGRDTRANLSQACTSSLSISLMAFAGDLKTSTHRVTWRIINNLYLKLKVNRSLS